MTLRVEELNGANCKTYLVSDGQRAALVDPVREHVATYQRLLLDRGLHLECVLETHTHADHLMLNRELKQVLGAPVVMHENSPSPLVDRHVSEGDVIELGSDRIAVVYTPGHTPDSVSYYLPSAGTVLTGDVLLIGGSGRTDFPGGDAGAQYDAVTGKLFELPDDTRVLPAHDYHGCESSTIGREKRENARFHGRSRAEYVELMKNLGLPFPDKIQQALQVNQSGFEASEVHFPLVSEVAAVPETEPQALALELGAAEPPIVLDVREPEEFTGELGHVRGALLVPMDLLERRLPKLAGYAQHEVVVVCRAGARSASAAAMLHAAGFSRVSNLKGGMVGWLEAELPVQY